MLTANEKLTLKMVLKEHIEEVKQLINDCDSNDSKELEDEITTLVGIMNKLNL